MPFTELFDETLDINSTGNYRLAVQVSNDNVSFSILDEIRNKIILLRNFAPDNYRHFTPGQIKEIIEKDDFLSRKYKKTQVIIPTPRFTIIPSGLYDPGKKEEYFSFNLGHPESSAIATGRLRDPDSYILYPVNEPVNAILEEHFPQRSTMCHLEPLFLSINHVAKNKEGLYIHAHIEADFFNLVIFNGYELRFCNSFACRNTSDIIYHILNVFKGMNISQQESIRLSGNAERYDELWSGLAAYIKNVLFADPSGTFTYSYVFNDSPLHRYINLFTAFSCE